MIKVAYLKQECLACPTLYSGEDIEGNEVHVRLRGGHFTVRHKTYENVIHEVWAANRWDGYFNEDDLHERTKDVLDLSEAEITSMDPDIEYEDSILSEDDGIA